ncbi:MAG TPA: hypothetical protein VHN82_01855 [Methanoregula sp.]|nr:hypothetical protein [Methanoregula sp.]
MCLALLIMIAILACAGCTDAVQEQQGQVPGAGNLQTEKPSPATTATTRMATVSVSQKITPSISAPVSSTGVIRLHPISDKTSGDTFTLTGTTSLPAGTNILWQILPDTGTPPTGLDGNSMMSVGGNNQVMNGEGTSNRIALSINLGRLVPGKYVAIVGKMKGDPSSAPVFEMGKDYGYAYFTRGSPARISGILSIRMPLGMARSEGSEVFFGTIAREG